MKVEHLYSMNMANEVESVAVLRETPKRYYTKPHRWIHGKFVPKDSIRWFPERVLAIQWMREILVKRVGYCEEDLEQARAVLAGQEAALAEFDVRYDVEVT